MKQLSWHQYFCQDAEPQIGEQQQVYTLTKEGYIECTTDADCPPTIPPIWNELTKMEDHGVESITEISIWGSYCSDFGNDFSNNTDNSFCEIRYGSFCKHPLGQNHPECPRCNVSSPDQHHEYSETVILGRFPHSLPAVSGTRSLTPTGLTDQSSSCPSSFCKRPSAARPGKIICCQLVQRNWGLASVAVCPFSCD